MNPKLPVVAAGPLPRSARSALRRAGAHLHRTADADGALGAALAHDALVVVGPPALAGPGTPLARLLDATGRGADLLLFAPRGQAAARCDRRGLVRRLRRRARARLREQAALEAQPAWQAMARAYRVHLAERLQALAQAQQAGDADTARAIVHDIKGTAGGFGLGRLTPAARDAQDHFLAGDAAAGFACCVRLQAQAREVLP